MEILKAGNGAPSKESILAALTALAGAVTAGALALGYDIQIPPAYLVPIAAVLYGLHKLWERQRQKKITGV